ncbi:MAG: Gfo/Idh/MocA family oxidoreductase [Pseudomonadota bacterium]|nr:Gfo/Idh/MocA family oxidoreductase [Pseudomonadota bacterium]
MKTTRINNRPLRIGAVGLGRAFSIMLPSFNLDPRIILASAADPREEARNLFEKQIKGRTYENIEALLDNEDVDAIYIGTPVRNHLDQITSACAAKKHLLVEKPMALTLEDSEQIIELVESSGIKMVVGHSHGFDRPIQKAREIIETRRYGRLRMISALNYTNFLYRPRRPDELNTSVGGGVIFSQAAHQVDIIRTLTGGNIKTVRAGTGKWDEGRPTEGAYNVFFNLEDGVTATATYSGYAHFDSDEFMDWRGESGKPKNPSEYWQTRKELISKTRDISEEQVKSSQTFGGKHYILPDENDQSDRLHEHFGLVIASCEHADLRPMPGGVCVYSDNERTFDRLPKPQLPRVEVIDELIKAIFENQSPTHDAKWAMANLEACLAIIESASKTKEVRLNHQVS